MRRSIQIKLLQKSFSRLSTLSPKLTAKFAAQLFTTAKKFKRPDWELELFKTTQHYRFKNKIAGYRWGKRGNPIILLLHGWNGRGTQLGKWIDPLVKAGFEVIAVDGPAHGNSPGKQSSPTDFCKALLQIGKELGPLHCCIGHSFGAGTLIHAAAAGLQVKKIVYISGPCHYDRVMRRFCDFMQLGDRATRIFVQRMNKIVGQTAEELCISKIVPNLKQKGFLVHDRSDDEVPFEEGVEIANAWNAKTHFTEGLGHFKILKDATVINTVCSFCIQET